MSRKKYSDVENYCGERKVVRGVREGDGDGRWKGKGWRREGFRGVGCGLAHHILCQNLRPFSKNHPRVSSEITRGSCLNYPDHGNQTPYNEYYMDNHLSKIKAQLSYINSRILSNKNKLKSKVHIIIRVYYAEQLGLYTTHTTHTITHTTPYIIPRHTQHTLTPHNSSHTQPYIPTHLSTHIHIHTTHIYPSFHTLYILI